MSREKIPPESDDIGCLEAIEGLYQWLDGELDCMQSIEHIEHHIEHCRSCYSRAEMERILTERIRQSKRTAATDSLKDRVHDLINKI